MGMRLKLRGIIVQVIVAPFQSQSFYDLCDPVMLLATLRLLRLLLMLLLQSMSLLLLPLLLLLLL